MTKSMKATFAVIRGPSWAQGKSMREHAAFMDKLFADGVVFMGGLLDQLDISDPAGL